MRYLSCTNEKARESYVHNHTIDHRLLIPVGCFNFKLSAV